MKCEDLLMKKRSPLLSVLVVLVLFLDLLSEDERGGKDFDFALPKGSSSSSSIIYIIQNV
jgi:hypothetical protein